MHFESQGMSLSYGTLDYPAPREAVQADQEITFTIAVQPIDASNKVEVRYRINQGVTRTLVAKWLRNQVASNSQYFKASLPAFAAGDTVEYTVICHCAGRQVPAPEQAQQLTSSFRVGESASLPLSPGTAPGGNGHTAKVRHKPTPTPQVPPGTFVVHGQVCQQDKSALGGATVQVFDKDLRGQELLGSAITDAEGCYTISYTADQFRRAEKGSADLMFQVSKNGIQRAIANVIVNDAAIPVPQIIFNAPTEVVANLMMVPQPKVTEYEEYLSTLTPVLAGVTLADLTDEDLAFLVGDTEITLERLNLLRQSAQLARQIQLPTEAFYGLARMELPLDLKILAELNTAKLHTDILSAIEKEIIPANLRDRLDAIVFRLKRYNYVSYQAQGQLIDQKTKAPLAQPGFKVHSFEVNGTGDPTDLGISMTDGSGIFSFSYTAPPAPSVSNLMAIATQFQLKITDPNNQPVAETEVSIALGQQDMIQVPVSIPVPKPQASHPIAQVLSATNLSVPPELHKFLSDRNLQTLDDIRRAGGLSALSDLPLPADHAAVMALEAHANLSRLSPDLQINASLIEKGFTSVAAIADVSRTNFVGAVHAQLGDFKAAQLHTVARAQTAFLNNKLTEMMVDRANGRVSALDMPGQEQIPDYCHCTDCEAAVSPAAYLTDLIKYALDDHLANHGQSIDLKFLTDMFHQPFGDLSVSCEAVEKQVRQVRICIEVMRSYLGTRPLASLDKETTLVKAEKEYLIAAYTQLLSKIGTSYNEIRVARAAKVEDRKALAQRLGISLTEPRPSTGDELEQLLLDPAAITEPVLESLFGLVDTSRDPLSDGPGSSNAQTTLTRWNLFGVEWGRNTDGDGYIYLAWNKGRFIDSGNFGLYREAQRTQLQLIASGDLAINVVST